MFLHFCSFTPQISVEVEGTNQSSVAYFAAHWCYSCHPIEHSCSSPGNRLWYTERSLFQRTRLIIKYNQKSAHYIIMQYLPPKSVSPRPKLYTLNMHFWRNRPVGGVLKLWGTFSANTSAAATYVFSWIWLELIIKCSWQLFYFEWYTCFPIKNMPIFNGQMCVAMQLSSLCQFNRAILISWLHLKLPFYFKAVLKVLSC